MAANELEIVVKERAAVSMAEIMIYISKEGNPERAYKLYENFYAFIQTLNDFPNKYPVCRKPSFFKQNYRCAIFKKNYIFIYKTFKTKIVIYNVIHSSRYVF
jgi:plasmid stabilization system protein ParE